MDPLTTRRQQLLDVLETIDNPDYSKFVGEMVESLDFERGFNILRHAMPRLQNLGEWESFLTTFQNRHGDLAKGVPGTLAECLRRETLTGMRHHISDPDHRFFLALLMNVPTREDIFAFISKRVPDQPPIATILEWAEEMIEPDDFGISLLDAAFPETLDVPFEEQFNLLILALENALENTPESKGQASEYPEIQAILENSCLRPLFS